LAATITWQDRQGWYVDGIVTAGKFDGNVTTPDRGQTMSMKGDSQQASVEGGYPFALGWQELMLEPQAQFVYQRLKFNRATDVDGIDVNLGSQSQSMVRVGVRLFRGLTRPGGSRLTPYLTVNVLRGLNGSGTVAIGGYSFATGTFGAAMQVGVGVTGTVSPSLAIYGDLMGQHKVSDGGVSGWSARAGLRYLF
jgi:outer membrane autotransporter protein